MISYSAEKMNEFIENQRGDDAVTCLALEAARAELAEDDNALVLVSSSLTALSPVIAEPLFAKAARISAKGSDQRVCRVVLTQSRKNSSRKIQVAESLFVFKVGETSIFQDASPEPPSEPALSSTAELRRRQIFEAACTVIAKNGFGNASMREIAKEAGLSVPLMYKYIKDKDDILYLITTLSMQDLFAHFDEGDFQAGTPEKNLTQAVDKYLDYIEDNRRYINLVYSETRSLSSENRQRVFDTERDLIRRWQAIIDDGIGRGAFKPMNSELIANAIYFLCTIWSLRHWSIGHIDKKTVHQELRDFILKGICK